MKTFLRLIDDAASWLKTGYREHLNQNIDNLSGDVTINSKNDIQKVVKSMVTSPSDSVNIPPVSESGAEKGVLRDVEMVRKRMREIEEEIYSCTKCRLNSGRKKAVPGEGNVIADIMFIGEGPGVQEDQQGRPFVGRAGQLLTKMLAAIQLRREEVYITNIVKCRPPENRAPLPDEVAACLPYLERQIEVVRPLIIVCLGGPAAQALVKTNLGITKLRGTFQHYDNIPVLPTYHPAAVLRFPERYKRDVWNDLKLLRDFYKDIRSSG